MYHRSAGKLLLGMAILVTAGLSSAAVAAADEHNVQRGTEIGVVNAGPSEVRASAGEGEALAGASEVRAGRHNEAWAGLGDERYYPFHKPTNCADDWNPGNVATAAVGGNLEIPGVYGGLC